MKRMTAVALTLCVASCAAPPAAQRPDVVAGAGGAAVAAPHDPHPPAASPPALSPIDAAKQAGCLGKPLDDCLKTLPIAFHFLDHQTIAEDLRRNEAVDVNGKRLHARTSLSVFGNLDGWDGLDRMQQVSLDYSAARLVTTARISLPGDPSLANTEEDYRKTGLYEGMVILLGSACPGLDRLESYRFFQNVVKPRIVREDKKTELFDSSAETSYFSKALGIPYCGRKFSFTDLFGYDTEKISVDNPHGVYKYTNIAFE